MCCSYRPSGRCPLCRVVARILQWGAASEVKVRPGGRGRGVGPEVGRHSGPKGAGTMRRVPLAIVAAVLLCAAVAPAARASDQWCEDDPLIVVVTPGGAVVPLYVTKMALGLEHLVAVQTAAVNYSVKPVGGGTATMVQVTVSIPDDLFGSDYPTRAVMSTGPLMTGVILA